MENSRELGNNNTQTNTNHHASVDVDRTPLITDLEEDHRVAAIGLELQDKKYSTILGRS
jgi:hypothetical protein